jgi:hypothetical protein
VAVKTWSSVSESTGSILGINGDSVFILTVRRTTQDALEAIKMRLTAGADPNQVGASSALIIPFAKLRRIQATDGRRVLEFFSPRESDDSKESRAKFPIKVRITERVAIAQEIARATGRPVTETSVDAGVLSVLKAPAVFAALIAGFTWELHRTAAELEAGKEVVAFGRRKGVMQLLIWLSGALGTTMTLVIGGVLMAAVIALAVALIVKRPQVHRLEFETASA